MYEGIIETLIKLFAIVTDVNSENSSTESSELVQSYLKENFSSDLVEKYMELYHQNIDYYHVRHREILYGNEEADQKGINSKYLKKICNSIVELFKLETRYMIVVQLLNFINKPTGISQQDIRTVKLVARGLKIDKAEYNDLKKFYLESIEKVEDKSSLFVVNGNEEYHDTEIKHLQRINQQVEVQLIRIKSINNLFFKYSGPRNLYLNGHRLAQNRLYLFPSGGILRTSRIVPIYYSSIMSRFIRKERKSIIIYNAENIEYRFSRKVFGLHPLSFQERSGDLVGILGGSGVGKTTLLNVLNGKLKPHKGKITINGYDLHNPENAERLQGLIGYVPQDDLLLEELTVYQNLEFNARFCFGSMTDSEIEEIIEQSLVDFDLVEARDLVVGSPLKKILSGGQRKRLNIALELMREPAILFADEPTSGLSSADSEKVMYLLKRQCLKGRLVIANIHQPSSDIFKLFDRLIVMDKGGRVVFFGNPMEAVTYFKHEAGYVNPDESECMACGNVKTEQPLRIIEERMVDPFGKSIRRRKIAPEDWYERYKNKVEPRVVDFMQQNPVNDEPVPEVKFKTPGWGEQLKLFLKRDYATKRSNRQYLSIALLEAPVLALILGFFSKFSPDGVYSFGNNDNIPAFFFMCVVVALFIGLSISAEEIFKDRKIRKREEFLNLSKGAYLTSKILMLFVLSAVQMASFMAIGYFMLDINGLVFSNWAILFSTACFANLLGLNLSSGLNSAVAIYILIPMLLVPQLLLSGVIVDFNKMHPSISNYSRTPLIGDLMASRWAYEAMAVNQFKNNKYRKHTFDLEQQKNKYHFMTYYWLPELEHSFDEYKRLIAGGEKAEALKIEPLMYNSFSVLMNEIDSVNKDGLEALRTNNYRVEKYFYYDSLLNKGRSFYLSGYQHATRELDRKLNYLLSSFNNNSGELVAYRNRYVNKKLESIMRDKYSFKKIDKTSLYIYQSDEAIFREPVYHNGRAQFYAPYKYLGNVKIGTVLFNILVLWGFSIFLMFALYFDLLRKAIDYVEKWQLLQLTKLRDKIFYNPMAFSKSKKK
ncbi:MAG: ATP-binding cassette domain-containing protein [Prolixibacteraceae bacterium]|nr:ATP-binding cassette domain-containing protein [Prolixibacteraceae bacterium]